MCSVVSDSLRPYGLQPARLPSPWDSTGKNTGGVPCPLPGDLLDPEIESTSPASPALQADSLLLSHEWSLLLNLCTCLISLEVKLLIQNCSHRLHWWLSSKESACQCRRHLHSIADPERSHMLRSNWACAPQLLSLDSRAREPPPLSAHAANTEVRARWSPRSATRGASTRSSLHTPTKNSPSSRQPEKSLHTATKTQHSQK